jgi:hypothetical protein
VTAEGTKSPWLERESKPRRNSLPGPEGLKAAAASIKKPPKAKTL